jgi:hypothetical protein
MQFTYTYLKSAEQNGIVVGHYKGCDVVPTTKAHLAKNGEKDDVIYLIYDDNNFLYQNGKVFATVKKNGDVDEFYARRYLIYERREDEKSAFVRTDTPAKEPSAAGDEVPTAADTSTSGNNEVIADVALGILVEDVLKGAREMSIDGLLKGFNYGLE